MAVFRNRAPQYLSFFSSNKETEEAEQRPREKYKICYVKPPATYVNKELLKSISENSNTRHHVADEFIVGKKSGRAWTMRRGDICRIEVISGSQVADVNIWNLHNKKERFYSGKTRQLHSTHVSTYDRLWSNLPFLRPLAIITADSIQYGIDEDGAGVHDVIGTRCDPYTYKLITGNECRNSCHTNILRAIQPYGLTEDDVHDVLNVFMCTGFTRDTGEYFFKPSPARTGDYFEFMAEKDLLVAMSVCPQGDVSVPVGETVPERNCHPLRVKIRRPDHQDLERWWAVAAK